MRDRSGGNIAFQPTCQYPDGFAFHSDWFKLVDTSSNAAITLKHQIARQTNGQFTLEFRFELPAPMDGVCWQLRDLEQACVSLVTKDGSLCVESGDGKFLVLARVENGRDYGIKVVADITTKTTDVLVDGELKAQAVSFAHLVRTSRARHRLRAALLESPQQRNQSSDQGRCAESGQDQRHPLLNLQILKAYLADTGNFQGEMDTLWDILYPAFQAEALPADAAGQEKPGQLIATLVAHPAKQGK